MNRRTAFICALLAWGISLTFPCLSLAWKAITNPPSVWRNLPVPYWVLSGGSTDLGGFDATVEVCELSLDSWENNDCTSWQVDFQVGTSASPFNSSDRQWVLGWIESGWPYEAGAIGVTMDMFGGGQIWGSDIAFNAVNFVWTTTPGGWGRVDAQSIVTHETGHFLGLDHACSTGQETMCPYYSGGTSERTLSSDDIAGVCALYPGTGPPPPSCTVDSDCELNQRCIGGKCVGWMCARCSTHEECGGEDDYCLSGFADGNFYCGISCISDPDCGEGNVCVDLGGGMRQCLPSTYDCSGSAPACSVSTECAPGYICEGGICVPQPPPECMNSEDCMPGQVCLDGRCVADTSPHNPPCFPCTSDFECGGDQDMCITFYPDNDPFVDGKSYCGRSCDPSNPDCETGMACFVYADKPAQCLPDAPFGSRACHTCDPVTFTVPCSEGQYCDFVNCSMGICRSGSPGTKVFGEACSEDTECEFTQCVQQVGGSFCSAACGFRPDFDTCQISTDERIRRMSCQPREFGACGYCSCARGRLGDACGIDLDCQSGAGGCLTMPLERGIGKVCSIQCGGGWCPSDFACEFSPDGVWGCFPIVKRPGATCTFFDRCLGGWCDFPEGMEEVEGAEGICTRSCEGGCQCPMDMYCKENGKGEEVCMPGSAGAKSGCGCEVAGIMDSTITPPAILLLFLASIFALARKKKKSKG